MIVKNISGERIFFEWIPSNGAYLDNNETREVPDQLSVNDKFRNSKNAGLIDVLSFDPNSLDYVVQQELDDAIAGVSGTIERLFRDIFTISSNGQTIIPLTKTPNTPTEVMFLVNQQPQEYGMTKDFYVNGSNQIVWLNRHFILETTDDAEARYIVPGP